LEVPTGNPAARVGALAVLDRQGKEVLLLLGGLGRDARGEHDGAAVTDDDGTVRLLGHPSGFEGEGLAVDVGAHSVSHTRALPPASGTSWRGARLGRAAAAVSVGYRVFWLQGGVGRGVSCVGL